MNRARAFLLWCVAIVLLASSGCLDKGTDVFIQESVSQVSEIVSMKKAGGEVLFPSSGVKVFLDPNDLSRDVQVQMDAVAPVFYGGKVLDTNLAPVSSYYVFAAVEFSNSNTADLTLPISTESLTQAVGSNGVMAGSIQVYQYNGTTGSWELRNTNRLLDMTAGTIRVTVGNLSTFVVGYYLHDPVTAVSGERVLFSSARAYKYINLAGSVLSSGDPSLGVNIYALNPADTTVSPSAICTTSGNMMLEDFCETTHRAMVGVDTSAGSASWKLITAQGLQTSETSISSDVGSGFGRASLSPDGTLLVVEGLPKSSSQSDRGLSTYETTTRTEIFMHEISTGKTQRITFNDDWDLGPSFTLDGKGVLFTRIDMVAGKASIYHYDRFTGTARRITSPNDNIGGTALAMLSDGASLAVLPEGKVVNIATGAITGDLGATMAQLLPPTHTFTSTVTSYTSPWATPAALVGRSARIMSLQETPQGDMVMELVLTDSTRANIVAAFVGIYRKSTGLLTLTGDPEYIDPDRSRGFRNSVCRPLFLAR